MGGSLFNCYAWVPFQMLDTDVLASDRSNAPTVVNNTYNSAPAPDNSELTATIRELRDRLNEPFVTVNTVTGDHGIQRAQEEYGRLMRNKSPKNRK